MYTYADNLFLARPSGTTGVSTSYGKNEMAYFRRNTALQCVTLLAEPVLLQTFDATYLTRSGVPRAARFPAVPVLILPAFSVYFSSLTSAVSSCRGHEQGRVLVHPKGAVGTAKNQPSSATTVPTLTLFDRTLPAVG